MATCGNKGHLGSGKIILYETPPARGSDGKEMSLRLSTIRTESYMGKSGPY